RGLFAAEGVGLIPLADGARHLAAELAADDGAAEVVVLAPGSAVPDQAHPSPRVGTDESLHVAFERELDLDRYPVLRAHVIDGRAVLPLALTLEWLAHAALHGHPGLAFAGCDGLRVFHPVTVRDGQVTPVRVFAGKATPHDGLHRVPVEL